MDKTIVFFRSNLLTIGWSNAHRALPSGSIVIAAGDLYNIMILDNSYRKEILKRYAYIVLDYEISRFVNIECPQYDIGKRMEDVKEYFIIEVIYRDTTITEKLSSYYNDKDVAELIAHYLKQRRD